MTNTRTATCNCGAIRIEARGEPVRVGLCHCTTCRKESGAPFTTNAIWRAGDVTIRGDTASWKDATDARHFCPSCGSALFGVSDGTGEIEIRLGALDVVPTNLVPTYELWAVRREKL
jgi:hypothetical protein